MLFCIKQRAGISSNALCVESLVICFTSAGQQVTDQWYSEVEKYDYAKANPSGTGEWTAGVLAE